MLLRVRTNMHKQEKEKFKNLHGQGSNYKFTRALISRLMWAWEATIIMLI